jgi:hypothetical protein
VNLHKTFALSLGLLGLVGITSVGAAGTLTKGSFTLPAQAYWNSTLLPAGEYTLLVERDVAGVDMVHLRGQGTTATFVAPAGSSDGPGRSCLKVDDFNGTFVVRELDAGPDGKAYYFGVSKAVKNLTLRGDAATPATIPVAATAGM